MRNAHATGAPIGDASPKGLVCVARDEDDPRCIYIPVDALVNPHVATDCGGRRRMLSRPTLGGYMERDLVPVGVPFGHDGSHGPGRIKVLVQETLTDEAVLEVLRERSTHAKLRRRRHPTNFRERS